MFGQAATFSKAARFSQKGVASVSSREPSQSVFRGTWILVLARACVAIVTALVITFSQSHSTPFGFIAFGAFAVASGLVLAVGSWAAMQARATTLVQGILTVAAGIVALVLSGGGLPFLIFLATFWAAVTGILELFCGLRFRGKSPRSRDWVFAGALTALFAIVVLIVPPDLEQSLGGVEGVDGVLTASVIVVGAVGAYAAILGVYLAIAGFSLKWGAPAPAEAVTESGDR